MIRPASEYRLASATKAARGRTIERVEAALRKAGAERTDIEFEHEPYNRRSVGLKATWRHFAVSIDLEGDVNLGAFLAHWYTRGSYDVPSKPYPVTFAADIAGGRNEYHGRKATGCYETLDQLCHYTARGFEALREEFA